LKCQFALPLVVRDNVLAADAPAVFNVISGRPDAAVLLVEWLILFALVHLQGSLTHELIGWHNAIGNLFQISKELHRPDLFLR
jgi:hypothetical protein